MPLSAEKIALLRKSLSDAITPPAAPVPTQLTPEQFGEYVAGLAAIADETVRKSAIEAAGQALEAAVTAGSETVALVPVVAQKAADDSTEETDETDETDEGAKDSKCAKCGGLMKCAKCGGKVAKSETPAPTAETTAPAATATAAPAPAPVPAATPTETTQKAAEDSYPWCPGDFAARIAERNRK